MLKIEGRKGEERERERERERELNKYIIRKWVLLFNNIFCFFEFYNLINCTDYICIFVVF